MRRHPLTLAATASLILPVALGVAGCTFVGTSMEAEKVRVLEPTDIASCRLLGKTGVEVLATLAGIPRPPETVQEELTNLARNTAADMGGDTVVGRDEPVDGKQTFDIYKCVDPDGTG